MLKAQIDCPKIETETKIYNNTADTLISIVFKRDPAYKIKIISKKYILNSLPDLYSNQKIKKNLRNHWHFTSNGSVWINIEPLYCKDDTVIVETEIRSKENGQIFNWENSSRKTLRFIYDSTLNTYILSEIIDWIQLR